MCHFGLFGAPRLLTFPNVNNHEKGIAEGGSGEIVGE